MLPPLMHWYRSVVRLAPSATVLLLLHAPLAAQSGGHTWDLLGRIDGTEPYDYLGSAVAGPGDVNLDGHADILIGVPSKGAYLYSGFDRQVLRSFISPAEPDEFSTAVSAAGDFDQDGFDDILIGACLSDPLGRSNAGSAFVFSGATGLLLHQFDGTQAGDGFGSAVSGGFDINLDGIDDLMIAAPRKTGSGSALEAGVVTVHSGLDGALLLQLDPAIAGARFGSSVAMLWDFDGDLHPDMAVGAPHADPGNAPDAGLVQIYSGATGLLLQEIWGSDAGDELGNAVQLAGDVNGDGLADVIAGAWRADPGGLSNAGSAFVYTGPNATLKHRFDGVRSGDGFGYAVSGAGDTNRDGRGDLIVGARFGSFPNGTVSGSASVFSGADGTRLWQSYGTKVRDYYGAAVASAGDIDNDGYADFAVGAFESDLTPSSVYDAGSVFVYSGRTGKQLRRFNGDHIRDRLGVSLANTGDANGDGVDDLVAGSLSSFARVYSSAQNTLLHEFEGQGGDDTFAKYLCSAGDVDSDGVPDIIIGAYTADPGGRKHAGTAYVYSGLTGDQLLCLDGENPYDFLGNAVVGVGDVNGDGHGDLLVGAPEADPNGLTSAGSAYLFSGIDGSILHRFDGEKAEDRLGLSVGAAGDYSGDGVPDLIIGAYWADPNFVWNAGSAFVYSGADFSLLSRFDGEGLWDYMGWAVAGAGDVNGDGYDDVVVAAKYADPGGRHNAGSVFLHAGPDGALIKRFDGPNAQDYLGFSVSAAGDVDLDGYADVLVGSKFSDPNGLTNAGIVYLLSGPDGEVTAEFHGENPNDELGSAVAPGGDLDGNGLPDLILSAWEADPNGESSGTVLLYERTDPQFRIRALDPVPVSHGTIEFFDATPDGEVWSAYSLAGPGPTPSSVGDLLLSDPYVELPIRTADAIGYAKLRFWIGAALSGVPIWLQGLDITTSTLSNGVRVVTR